MNTYTLKKIKDSPLMNGIEDAERLAKCFEARTVSFRRGTEIIGYGDEPAIVIITSGSATVTDEDWFGNRNIINRIGVSGIFGAAFVYSSHEVTSRLVAAEEGEAVIMSGQKLHTQCDNCCRSHTRFLYNTLKVVSNSCVGFLEKVEHLSRRTTRDKVLAYLSSQSIKHGQDSFEIPFSRQELADYLAVDRCALSSELGRMKADGLIDFSRSHFIIKKRN